MIDCTVLAFSQGYTLLFIQILSPVIYYRGLHRAGSPTLFRSSFPRGKREQISRKVIPSDVVIARKSNLVKGTNRRIYRIGRTNTSLFMSSYINSTNYEKLISINL